MGIAYRITLRELLRGVLPVALLLCWAGVVQAKMDTALCLACHNASAPKTEDPSKVSLHVDAKLFKSSVHAAFGCPVCHTDIEGFPHKLPTRKVSCEGCHATQSAAFRRSVHANVEKTVPGCLNCHGNPHGILPKRDPASNVYTLNLPRTCGRCHGNAELAKRYGFPDVYALYMDSIHGFALTKDGLLVAAECSSCHGTHEILSRKDPNSRTNRRNIPATCGSCHAGVKADYMDGVHGKNLVAGNLKVPVCNNCHTAHRISEVQTVEWQVQTISTCGGCHQERLRTYRDTFHGQVTALGFSETARCWSCHGSHKILPASDPRSSVAPANLRTTCGRCHKGASASFVSYQPHADPRDKRRFPALYFATLFMNLLLAGVFTFFGIHTVLWLFRSLFHHLSNHSGAGN